MSTQEDHAELSAQFAAHWGKDKFSRLRPYNTMVLATTFHDSGYREWEENPPINLAKGRPYASRNNSVSRDGRVAGVGAERPMAARA